MSSSSGITKHFGGAQALNDVTVRIMAGTVHSLVGENGAGKSTLSKICAGVITPDAGQIRIDGAEAAFRSPRDVLATGIATIAEELALVPRLRRRAERLPRAGATTRGLPPPAGPKAAVRRAG